MFFQILELIKMFFFQKDASEKKILRKNGHFEIIRFRAIDTLIYLIR